MVQENVEVPSDKTNGVLLSQFKDMVADAMVPGYYLHADDELMKYCAARRWDLKKAEIMFRQAMSFRQKMRLDHILEEFTPPETVQKYLTGGIVGFDKEGCPVRIERFGNLDTKGIYYACKRTDLEKFKLYEQEYAVKLMKEQSIKLKKKISKLTVVMDLQGINSKQLWRPGLQLYLHLVKLLEDNYPELVKHLIVVNAPRIFPLFFKVCKPLISEDMRKKLQVYGTNYQSHLLEVIDAEELPAFLGGKQMGPNGDIYCKHKIRAGGPVPESCYLKETVDTSQFESAMLAAGSKLVLKVPIESPNSVINWEFMTEDKDIGFGLSMTQNEKDKSVVLMPNKRYPCDMVPEDGSYTCNKSGVYMLKFDNSYSWTKSKKLYYSIEVLEEDDEIIEEVNEISDGKQFSQSAVAN